MELEWAALDEGLEVASFTLEFSPGAEDVIEEDDEVTDFILELDPTTEDAVEEGVEFATRGWTLREFVLVLELEDALESCAEFVAT